MSLTARDIAEITRLLEDSSFDELEVEIDGMKIHLRRSGAKIAAPETTAGGGATRAEHAAMPAPSRAAPALVNAAEDPALVPVRAPLLGTFYRAPKPGAPAFVEVGTKVEPETIIGIIEVMKLMNTVRADTRGRVCSIRALDGSLVEYGETLLSIDPREAG